MAAIWRVGARSDWSRMCMTTRSKGADTVPKTLPNGASLGHIGNPGGTAALMSALPGWWRPEHGSAWLAVRWLINVP